MPLSVLDIIQIRRIILSYKDILGKESDNLYLYPKCLENIKVVRYENKENKEIMFNGKIALWLAQNTENGLPILVFENTMFEVPRKHFIIIENLNEGLLSTKTETYNAKELQDKLEPITKDDYIDLHIYLKMIDEGINIFNSSILDNT